MKHYIALVYKEENIYGVIFPDFPGCVTTGDTLDQACDNAIEALSLHVDGLQSSSVAIPEPRSLEDIKSSDEDWYDLKEAIVLLTPLIPLNNKAVRIQITIDNRLLNRIDSVSKNRSAFLEEAARQWLKGA